MTTQVDIVNLALQSFGSRTTVTAAELVANSTNEAKQVNVTYDNTRTTLLRMAPWNCALSTTALSLIASNLEKLPWVQGLPRPPWIYEYAYPTDCLKPCWIDPGLIRYAVGVDTIAAVQQRVILTDKPDAVLINVRDVTDPEVWDPLFQDAMANALGANICIALTGDKSLANMCIQLANASIIEARKSDGNEGLTINDVNPDWIRTRGFGWTEGPSMQYPFDWGGLIPSY